MFNSMAFLFFSFFFFGLITRHKIGTGLFSELEFWHSLHIKQIGPSTWPHNKNLEVSGGWPWVHHYKLCPVGTGDSFSDSSLKGQVNTVGWGPKEVAVGLGERGHGLSTSQLGGQWLWLCPCCLGNLSQNARNSLSPFPCRSLGMTGRCSCKLSVSHYHL